MDNEALNELYQSIIIEHALKPRNYGMLNTKTAEKRVFNPTCGDDITVNIKVKKNRIRQISFYGDGCFLCKASASMMTELITNCQIATAQKTIQTFFEMVTNLQAEQNWADLGEASVFKNVTQFPIRVKCILLPWSGLKACFEGEKNGSRT